MKQAVFFTLLTAGTVFLTGCYTQLTTIDRTPPPEPREDVQWVIDTATGDTVKVVRQVDTIHTEDHQTCIWERDLMGYPHLRCYDSFYPRDWFYYNNSPWWYRNDPYWYDYDRCPRYYYYDPSCGCCRYTADFYHSGRGRGHYGRDGIQIEKTEPSGPSGTSTSPRVRGIPDPKSGGTSSSRSGAAVTSSTSTRATAGTATETRSSGTIVVPSSSETTPSANRERGRGVPERGSAPSSSSSPTPPPSTTGSSGSGKSGAATSSSVAPSRGSSSPPPSSNDNQERNRSERRRKPRSW